MVVVYHQVGNKEENSVEGSLWATCDWLQTVSHQKGQKSQGTYWRPEITKMISVLSSLYLLVYSTLAQKSIEEQCCCGM